LPWVALDGEVGSFVVFGRKQDVVDSIAALAFEVVKGTDSGGAIDGDRELEVPHADLEQGDLGTARLRKHSHFNFMVKVAEIAAHIFSFQQLLDSCADLRIFEPL
jgi:hypothetical protein